MGALQPGHLLVILVIVLIIFGAGRLPETLRDVGRGVRTFRDEAEGKSQPEVSTVTCASCGTGSPKGTKFCQNCGKALSKTA